MVNALFDTNILIDYLNRVDGARAEMERYDNRAISVISRIEVLVGARPEEEAGTRAFLDSFLLAPLSEAVVEEAVALRRAYRMRLPDAIIWASARAEGRLFVTRNTKDFPAEDPGVRAPYRL